MDAARIVSLSHVGVAANAALGRFERWDQDAEDQDAEPTAGDNKDTGVGIGGSSRDSRSSRNRRGIGQELVVCAAGTSHAGYAVRDYGFQPEAAGGGDIASNSNNSNKKRKKQQQNEPTTPATNATGNAGGTTAHTVLAIGFDCKDDQEYQTFLADVGLSNYPSSNSVCMEEYFHRERSEQELGRLMKAYKISQSEIDMDGSSLENAVLTRVATKFAV